MSFIASLATVGTAAAGMAGITGLGTTAAALTGAGVLAAGGAGLGAATSAAMGGDPGEGALMGAVTAPLMAPLMPAASAGGAAAGNVGTNVATNVGTDVAKQAAIDATTQAGAQGVGTGLTTYGLGQAPTAFTGELTGGALGNVAGGVGQNAIAQTGAQGIEQLAANPLVNATTTQIVPKTVAMQALPEVATPSWGSSLIGNAFNTPVTGTMAKVGGGALENAVYGAGINSGINLLTGRPITENMGTSALAGGIGGAAGAGLATQAGQSGMLGKIGKFAAENPGITSTAISVPTSMALNSMTAPDTTPTMPSQKSQFQYKGPSYNYSPENFTPYDVTQDRNRFPIYQPTYMAAGGITDLDGFASQAQNVEQGLPTQAQSGIGTLQVPNPKEVADPTGYIGNSAQMMAQGGIASFKIGGDLKDLADTAVAGSLPGMIFDWKSASDLPLIGGLFNKPEEIATLTPEEKQKLMAMAAQGQQPMPAQVGGQPMQMAHGGIADLGGYSKGGNLLAGPGDGVSDDIPASIAGKQPARLASGEYVVPSRIVSELGNGSTDAGAKRLDMMVQKINAGRAKTLGGKRYAKDTHAYKHLPA